MKNKIGIMVDSFKLGLHEGIRKAGELSVKGLQIYAVSGEMDPERLDKLQRKALLREIRSNGLTVAALCGDLGGYGFTKEEENPVKIEKSKRIMHLARDLECGVVTTHIGVIPEDENCQRYAVLQNACEELGNFADDVGACFAIESGPEKAAILRKFLDSLHSHGVRVNLDPANFIMVTGDDPVAAVYMLKDYIVHTHVKDGIMLRQENPETIYNFFAQGGIGDLHLGDYFMETPLGEGKVDFDRYFAALREVGYEGFYTIEREVGEKPVQDIAKAVEFLRAKL